MPWDWFTDLLDTPIDLWTLFLIMLVLIALWGLTLVWLVPRYIAWLERREARQKAKPVARPDEAEADLAMIRVNSRTLYWLCGATLAAGLLILAKLCVWS
jgi:hypothetical protein